MKEFDTLVFIGRFQPFHNGHKAVIDEALKLAKQVTILVGSSYAPRNIRNPFTYDERVSMIESNYPESVHARLHIEPLPDYPYDDQRWAARVQKLVEYYTLPGDKIGLIGHTKDHTSYYLKMFPEWKDSVEVPNVDGINATDIRNSILAMQWRPNTWKVSDNTLKIIKNILYADEYGSTTDVGDTLFYEYDLIKKYKESWAAAPYPPTFVTVDAVVIQSAHILLIKRKSAPGIGQWALPGGFLNQTETRVDGMLRELSEETKIKVPTKVLKGSIKNQRTFDDPNRSTRGRTITTAFYIELENDFKLPKVTGADDAEKAKWIPLSQVKSEDMFEDHYHIIDYFVKLEEL